MTSLIVFLLSTWKGAYQSQDFDVTWQICDLPSVDLTVPHLPVSLVPYLLVSLVPHPPEKFVGFLAFYKSEHRERGCEKSLVSQRKRLFT